MRNCISQLIVLNASERHFDQKSLRNFYKRIYLQTIPPDSETPEVTVIFIQIDRSADFILNTSDRQAASF